MRRWQGRVGGERLGKACVGIRPAIAAVLECILLLIFNLLGETKPIQGETSLKRLLYNFRIQTSSIQGHHYTVAPFQAPMCM